MLSENRLQKVSESILRIMEEKIMNPENKITQSQKMMVFVLSMSLYSLATLSSELPGGSRTARMPNLVSRKYIRWARERAAPLAL